MKGEWVWALGDKIISLLFIILLSRLQSIFLWNLFLFSWRDSFFLYAVVIFLFLFLFFVLFFLCLSYFSDCNFLCIYNIHIHFSLNAVMSLTVNLRPCLECIFVTIILLFCCWLLFYVLIFIIICVVCFTLCLYHAKSL